MRVALALLLALIAAPVAGAQRTGAQLRPATLAFRIRYRAHDGQMRPAWRGDAPAVPAGKSGARR